MGRGVVLVGGMGIGEGGGGCGIALESRVQLGRIWTYCGRHCEGRLVVVEAEGCMLSLS